MDKELKELIVVKGKVIEQTRGYSPNVGEEISYEQGAKLIKNHYDQNPDDVVAQFTGKNQIEKILAQPGCIGIRTFYAINEIGIRTLIFVGVDKDGNNIIEIPGEKYKSIAPTKAVMIKGSYFCPPYCGGATGSDTSSWSSNY